MFEKFGTEEWGLFIQITFWVIGGITTILMAIATWTLKYIIEVAENTASMAASLESLRSDIDTTAQKIENLDKQVDDHETRITVIESNKSCSEG